MSYKMLEHWLGSISWNGSATSASEPEPREPRGSVVAAASSTASSSSSSEEPASACLFAGYPPWMFYFAAACCALFMLVGIPGNLITVAALYRTKKLKNATTVFIMNLSISDLMFCCFNLPLAMSNFLHGAWIHGPLLCQLFPLLRYGLVAVSLFTVLAITINRYVMIGHPRRYPKVYKRRNLWLMVLATWLGGFGALIPTWFGRWGRFGLDPELGSCSILPDASGHSPKEFLFVLAFLAPCFAIVVCYARIFYIVRRTARKSRRRDDAARELLRVQAKCSRNIEQDSAIGSMSCHATHTTGSENGGSSPPRCNEQQHQQPIPALVTTSIDPDCGCSRLTVPELRVPIEDSNEQPQLMLLDTRSLAYRSNRTSDASRCFLSPPDADDQLSEDGAASSRSNSPSPSERRATISPLRRQSRLLQSTKIGRQTGRETGRMTEKDKKLLKMILVIFLAFVVCYLPITISKTFNTIDWRGLNIAGYILIYMTTCINPLIYMVMSSEYRRVYKNVLLCRSEPGSTGQQQQQQQQHPERPTPRSPRQGSPQRSCPASYR